MSSAASNRLPLSRRAWVIAAITVALVALLIGAALLLRAPPSDGVAVAIGGQLDLKPFDTTIGNCPRQLQFESAQLVDVINELNRCSNDTLVIADGDPLGRLQLSGLFVSGDTESFVAALEKIQMATVDHQADGTIVLRGMDQP